MTNEEAIEYIEKWKTDYSVDAKDREVLLMAIKALEQTDILDKIRAEIIENSIEDYKYHGCGTDELIIETSEVLRIFDKYKAESEDKE